MNGRPGVEPGDERNASSDLRPVVDRRQRALRGVLRGRTSTMSRVYDRALDSLRAAEPRCPPPWTCRCDALRGPGLVAAYEFNAEARVKRATDASRENNTGSIRGAAWTSQVASAMPADSTAPARWCGFPPSTSLDLDDAMTLAAWVRPTASQAGWRTAPASPDRRLLPDGPWRRSPSERLAALDRLAPRCPGRRDRSACVRPWSSAAAGSAVASGSWWPPLALFVVGSLVDARSRRG